VKTAVRGDGPGGSLLDGRPHGRRGPAPAPERNVVIDAVFVLVVIAGFTSLVLLLRGVERM
jgi:hypothetical protein